MTPMLEQLASTLLTLTDAASKPTFDAGPPAILTIPPRHTDVGGVTIYDDGDELTIEIGGKHHTHFSADNFEADCEAERLKLASRAAAQFIADLVSDRICVTVDFIGDRCIGSSHFYLDAENTTPDTIRDTTVGIRGGNIRSERYLWSAPIPEPRT